MIHLPKHIDEKSERLHAYETHWKRVALDLLVRHAGQQDGGSLLDYGCGRGETLSLAAAHGMKAQGVDLDPECVELSSRHGPACLLEHPDDPLRQFEEKSFDVVTCFHVLEHVRRPQEVLTALGRIARRHLLVAVPNLRSLPRPRHFRSEPDFVNEGHLHGWDHAHFRNLAERHCGLKLVAWGFDHVKIPLLSAALARIAGDSFLRRCETGPFVRLFPYHSASLIALLSTE
jgi:SAM-dependent methyltransferase